MFYFMSICLNYNLITCIYLHTNVLFLFNYTVMMLLKIYIKVFLEKNIVNISEIKMLILTWSKYFDFS